MPLLEIKNLSKSYSIDKDKKKTVLSNINLSFFDTGLVFIVGKSGCGKSTLLNLISLMDKPSSGCVKFNNEDIFKFTANKRSKYRNKDIGIIFQDYNLIDDLNVIDNIMLPMLVAGENKKAAKEDAITLLSGIEFPKKLFNQKITELSGGEKQRVSVLRSIINNPKVLLCDEPTGALDSENSKLVMDMLKQASKTRLIIVVSHNLDIVNKYAERVILLEDKKVKSDTIIRPTQTKTIKFVKQKRKVSGDWKGKLLFSNFKNHRKRNLISFISLSISLFASLIIMAFSFGAKESVKNASFNQFDLGTMTLNKEISNNKTSSGISLVKVLKPTYSEIKSINKYLDNYIIEANYDYLLNRNAKFEINAHPIDEINLIPVYSFLDDSTNREMLTKGRYPSDDSMGEILVNQKAYSMLKNSVQEPLENLIDFSVDNVINFTNQNNEIGSEIFDYKTKLKIVGVVNEFTFLNKPKIFYSYKALKKELENMKMVNYSDDQSKDISWLEYIENGSPSDVFTSYSYRMFLKDKKLFSDNLKLPDPFVINSNALTISNTLLDLVDLLSGGMTLFLIIALVGTVFINGIVSFANYSLDKKKAAILRSFGTEESKIFDLYITENILLSCLSFAVVLILTILFESPINSLIEKITSFKKIINLNNLLLMDDKVLTVATSLSVIIFISFLSTLFPILLSKKSTIQKELRSE